MAITVTATQGGSAANGMALRVMVLTGAAAAQNGGSSSASGGSVGTLSVTTTQAGSRVYGAALRASSTAPAVASGTTQIDGVPDSTHGTWYGTWKGTSVTGTPGATNFGYTSTFTGGMSGLEVLPAGTLTEDSSGPAAASTTTATTVTTASFSPPGGSLLVALVSADGGASVTTMTVSDSSGLTWAEAVKGNAAGDGYTGVWTAAVPGAAMPPGTARRVPYRAQGGVPSRRYRAAVVPPQLDAPFPVTESRQWRQPRGMQPRRGHGFTVVPPQLNPPYPFAETVQRRETWLRGVPRRGRRANVVPPQLNPPYPFTGLRQWRQPRGLWPRRGHGFAPVPAQQAAVPNPAWVQSPLRHARLAAAVRRRPAAVVPAVQDVPLQAGRHARPAVPPRRGHVMWLPQAQAAVPPAWVQSHRAPAKAIALIRRRFRQLMPWPQAVQPPFSVGTLTAADTPGAVLTATGTTSVLTAAGAALDTLTATDQKAGGPS